MGAGFQLSRVRILVFDLRPLTSGRISIPLLPSSNYSNRFEPLKPATSTTSPEMPGPWSYESSRRHRGAVTLLSPRAAYHQNMASMHPHEQRINIWSGLVLLCYETTSVMPPCLSLTIPLQDEDRSYRINYPTGCCRVNYLEGLNQRHVYIPISVKRSLGWFLS